MLRPLSLLARLEASEQVARTRPTILPIDGLDITTRDPQPERALRADLPEPAALPPGVLIVLGTQTTDLPNLSAGIRVQVGSSDRRLALGALDAGTVDAVIDASSGNSRVGIFATAPVEELVELGEMDRAHAVASAGASPRQPKEPHGKAAREAPASAHASAECPLTLPAARAAAVVAMARGLDRDDRLIGAAVVIASVLPPR